MLAKLPNLMSAPLHPNDVLFAGERPFPALPACDHYCGSEKLIRKSLALQRELGPLFDITCDCEDGAHAGAEREHATMVAELIAGADNLHGRVGARIHDLRHPHWRDDLDIILAGAGQRLAFLTLPKATGIADLQTLTLALNEAAARHGLTRPIPLHVLIETHGALREAWAIASHPQVECIDFGLMDFVSAHHGAIPAEAMRSPGQFQHPLVVRAKCEIVAAALAAGVIPAHNVTTELHDAEVVGADARRARRDFGFLRMWSIHPDQIRPIVAAMQPDFGEVCHACDILLAAQAAAWGPIRHQGRLHDRASYRYYWELLQRARMTGVELPQEAGAAFFAAQHTSRQPKESP
jgi:citrate lyase subunit beta/citryl-CoA lyase